MIWKRRGGASGFSLAELSVAMATSLVLGGVLFSTLISIQRSFKASERHVEGQTTQLRLMDYIGLDARRAIRVQVTGGDQIDFWIPDYYQTTGGDLVPRDPVRDSATGKVEYNMTGGSATWKQITYQMNGDDLVRVSGTATQTLASGVKGFTPNYSVTNQQLRVAVEFKPSYRVSGAGSSYRAGTRIETQFLVRNQLR
jgi:hypothetical protein